MPKHPFTPLAGRIETIEVDSKLLSGNLLGDPSRRQSWIYLPPGFDSSASAFPTFVYLSGYTGSALKKAGWRAFEENIPQRLERLVREGRMGPVVLVLPDSFTSLGGNQFLDSPVLGRWQSYLLQELLPAVETRFGTDRNPRRRALLGFSSGGYGALRQALLKGESWGAIAAHSPDIGFELAFRSDLAVAVTCLARRGVGIEGFLQEFRDSDKVDSRDLHCLMLLGLAASYDPDPSHPPGIRLPVDPQTCELIPERWRNWLENDPLELIEKPDCRQSLRSLPALFLDCGKYDQYHLQYGLRRFARRLQQLGIGHRYEEFPGSHTGVEYRLDESLPYLYQSLEGV